MLNSKAVEAAFTSNASLLAGASVGTFSYTALRNARLAVAGFRQEATLLSSESDRFYYGLGRAILAASTSKAALTSLRSTGQVDARMAALAAAIAVRNNLPGFAINIDYSNADLLEVAGYFSFFALAPRFALEGLESAVSGAFALHRLIPSYTGNLIRVLRNGDNAITWIGQDSNGELDVAALLAFANNNPVRVITWADQSGVSDISESGGTGAGIVFTSNSLKQIGSKPTLDFATNRQLQSTTARTTAAFAAVFRKETSGNYPSTHSLADVTSSDTNVGRRSFLLSSTSGLSTTGTFPAHTAIYVNRQPVSVTSTMFSPTDQARLLVVERASLTGNGLKVGNLRATTTGGCVLQSLCVLFNRNLTNEERVRFENNLLTYYNFS